MVTVVIPDTAAIAAARAGIAAATVAVAGTAAVAIVDADGDRFRVTATDATSFFSLNPTSANSLDAALRPEINSQ